MTVVTTKATHPETNQAQQTALQVATSRHDPGRYEGRSWEELSLVEQEAALVVAEDSLDRY